MNTPISKSTIYWRCLFIGLETIVVVTILSRFLVLIILSEDSFRMRMEVQSYLWPSTVLGFVELAWLFLFIVSPFFLRSLRGVALAGWIIAFGILIAGDFHGL